MKIITLAKNRPDFIKIQYESIKKHIKGDFEFVVYDDSKDGLIKNQCDKVGVQCVKIQNDGGVPYDPSMTVQFCLREMWQQLKHDTGMLVYLDSDMFFTREIDVLSIMNGYDWAYVPQFRGSVEYPWTGLMFMNMDTLPNKDSICWDIATVDGQKLDVGGANAHYIRDNKIKVLQLDMWSVLGVNYYSYNGVDTIDVREQHLKLEKLVEHFPKPAWVDVFAVKGKPFGEAFVFHYKSGSNYKEFATNEYNRLKTEAMIKIL